MSSILDELGGRWTTMFSDLASGSDLAPARRLRTEGMMEAAVLLQIATEEELSAAMEECYQLAFGRSISEDFGADWRAFFPFPQIPAMGRRAPVFPTTRN